MTLYEFNILNDNEKANLVWEIGHCLNSIKLIDSSFSLYSVSDFFVEFELKENEITAIRSFIKGEHFNKYLEQIDITQLLNTK